MKAIAITELSSASKDLVRQQHQLRARIFGERLGWEVTVVDGLEADCFDDLNPVYIVATDKGHVVGCARLLPATGPTMVEEVFSSLLPGGRLQSHHAMIESSRFCVDTEHERNPGGSGVHETTLTMFSAIIEWCLTCGYTEIVTATDLRFEKILLRVGWPLQRLGRPQRIGVTDAVAGLLPATEAHFQRLRPQAYQSNIKAFGHAA
jgi:acyl homoserine lactone synthase